MTAWLVAVNTAAALGMHWKACGVKKAGRLWAAKSRTPQDRLAECELLSTGSAERIGFIVSKRWTRVGRGGCVQISGRRRCRESVCPVSIVTPTSTKGREFAGVLQRRTKCAPIMPCAHRWSRGSRAPAILPTRVVWSIGRAWETSRVPIWTMVVEERDTVLGILGQTGRVRSPRFVDTHTTKTVVTIRGVS